MTAPGREELHEDLNTRKEGGKEGRKGEGGVALGFQDFRVSLRLGLEGARLLGFLLSTVSDTVQGLIGPPRARGNFAGAAGLQSSRFLGFLRVCG